MVKIYWQQDLPWEERVELIVCSLNSSLLF